MTAPVIDISVQSPLWDADSSAVETVRHAIAVAAAAERATGEVSVLLTDDAAMRLLNREWREIDKPTNVLSFPATKSSQPLIGDIAIGYETVRSESTAEHTPFLHHLAHLAVHGFLHLLGYDHQNDSQAEAMEGLERDILARIGIADPYRLRESETGNA
jgi:probable rRNA maturation factor